MNKRSKVIFKVLGFILMVSLLSTPLVKHGVSPFLAMAIVAGALIMASKLKLQNFAPGAYAMDVRVQIWENHVEDNLFKDNQFLLRSRDVSQYVLEGKVVHIPQAAAPSGVQINRQALPAPITQRADTDVTYNIDEYTTNPRLISNADTVELSYDKRESVIMDDELYLQQSMADNMLINWAPIVNSSLSGYNGLSLVTTTGTSTAAWTPNGTGNHNALTAADVRAAQKQLNKMLVPKAGRCLLLSADMYDQLLADLTANNMYPAFAQPYDLKAGIMGRLHGFDVYVRTTVLYYDSSNNVRPNGAVLNATDRDAALFWVDNKLEFGRSGVKMFQDSNNPLYYGDIYSFLLRAGGRISRQDQAGVGVIIAA